MDWRIGLLFPDTGRCRTKKHYRRLLTFLYRTYRRPSSRAFRHSLTTYRLGASDFSYRFLGRFLETV
jgi:hypothetical protein